MTDTEVKLTGYLSEKKYPESFLYKKRWLIEMFFKCFKQHLKIKKFWGTTENAVRIKSVLLLSYTVLLLLSNMI